MTNFPNLSSLSSNPNIGNIFSLPNNTYPFYWLWIMGGLWLIISLTTYFKDKEKRGTASLLSSIATASFVIMILSAVGTLVGIISSVNMIYILVFSMIIIGIWFFSGR